MDLVTTRGGRYIPAGAYASEAERVRALENFISRYSEEEGYALDLFQEELAELREMMQTLYQTVATLQTTVRAMGVVVDMTEEEVVT